MGCIKAVEQTVKLDFRKSHLCLTWEHALISQLDFASNLLGHE